MLGHDLDRDAHFARAFGVVLVRTAILVREHVNHVVGALGEASSELLGSLRILPTRLTEAGFTFDHEDVREIIQAALADWPRTAS